MYEIRSIDEEVSLTCNECVEKLIGKGIVAAVTISDAVVSDYGCFSSPWVLKRR
jgi:hypothetical protein